MEHIKKMICIFFGHKKAEPMLYEDNLAIYTEGCPRCKTPTLFPTTWKGCPPPPNSTPEQIEKFNEWKENHYAEVRFTALKK
jgi:hypothetical protein